LGATLGAGAAALGIAVLVTVEVLVTALAAVVLTSAFVVVGLVDWAAAALTDGTALRSVVVFLRAIASVLTEVVILLD
jgi:hypothetical protein